MYNIFLTKMFLESNILFLIEMTKTILVTMTVKDIWLGLPLVSRRCISPSIYDPPHPSSVTAGDVTLKSSGSKVFSLIMLAGTAIIWQNEHNS
jgi:hypothetical protein